mmetsp:Transcript_11836/g.21594  ORF Transcript_11836/g.21594 Transcript_11836/m.21594 type:complete len:684 (-) Transcript_11836:40-2091(-)
MAMSEWVGYETYATAALPPQQNPAARRKLRTSPEVNRRGQQPAFGHDPAAWANNGWDGQSGRAQQISPAQEAWGASTSSFAGYGKGERFHPQETSKGGRDKGGGRGNPRSKGNPASHDVVHHHPPPDMAQDVGNRSRGGQTLLIAYFPWEATELDIEKEFSKFCKVKRVHLVVDKSSQRPRCFGFVKFWTKSDADMALDATSRGDVQLRDSRGHVWHVKAEWSKSGDMVVDDVLAEQEVAKRREERRGTVRNTRDRGKAYEGSSWPSRGMPEGIITETGTTSAVSAIQLSSPHGCNGVGQSPFAAPLLYPGYVGGQASPCGSAEPMLQAYALPHDHSHLLQHDGYQQSAALGFPQAQDQQTYVSAPAYPPPPPPQPPSSYPASPGGACVTPSLASPYPCGQAMCCPGGSAGGCGSTSPQAYSQAPNFVAPLSPSFSQGPCSYSQAPSAFQSGLSPMAASLDAYANVAHLNSLQAMGPSSPSQQSALASQQQAGVGAIAQLPLTGMGAPNGMPGTAMSPLVGQLSEECDALSSPDSNCHLQALAAGLLSPGGGCLSPAGAVADEPQYQDMSQPPFPDLSHQSLLAQRGMAAPVVQPMLAQLPVGTLEGVQVAPPQQPPPTRYGWDAHPSMPAASIPSMEAGRLGIPTPWPPLDEVAAIGQSLSEGLAGSDEGAGQHIMMPTRGR